eukprot:403373456
MEDFLEFKDQWEKEGSASKKPLKKQSTQKAGAKQQEKVIAQAKQTYQKQLKEAEKQAPPPGPLSYKPNFNVTEKKAIGFSFGKGSKEVDKTLKIKNNQIEKTDNRLILYPNIDATRTNYHGNKTLIKQPLPKPKQLEEKLLRSSQMETDRQSEVSTQASEFSDSKKKIRQGITIAPIPFSKLSDQELERYLRMEIKKNPHLIKRKLTFINPNYSAIERNIPGPKIVNKKTVNIQAFERDLEEWRRPNVFTYSPDGRKVKQSLPLYSFAKSSKFERTPSPDRRKALIIDESQVRKRVPKIAILPEHEVKDSELLKEFEKTRLGPASYKVSFIQTERRADFGVLKIKEQYVIKEEEEEDDRPNLYPNYDIDKPNKGVFKYHEPSKDLGPQHTPEKIQNPGKWRFYDYDLDVVREQLAKDIAFARNMSVEEFKEKEEFHDMIVERLKRQEKRPAVGQYDPERPETKIEVDFSKAQGRDPYVDPDYLLERDIEGDVLILDPQKPLPHLPDINFDKQLGREEEKFDSEDINMHQELILEPNIDAIRKKKQFYVDFDKQIGRVDLEKKHIDDDEVFVHNLSFREIRANDPADKKIVVHDFGKQESRFKEDEKLQRLRDMDIQPDELIIENDLPAKRVKGNVQMDKDTVERFPVKINKDPFYNDQPLTDG